MRKSTMLYGYSHERKEAQRFGFDCLRGCPRWYDGDDVVELTDDEKIVAQLVNHSRNKKDIIAALKSIDDKHKKHVAIDYNVEIVDIM